MYTEEVMKQFMHPKNMGEIKNADGIGKAGNFICGDIMWIFIKVEKNKKEEVILKDIKFKTLGCAAAIATSSMITELAKGETLEGALKITKQDVANALGGLPPIKIHCSVLAADALSEAVYDYLSKNDLPISRELVKTHERIGKELETTEKKA
ncbi:MAG: iron-sulfur cluster assembly scaffold protein [Methanosarcinales archaeon Met12]|nr:MAG: iron-sulfur cluster assembly scaffold protein [Methanosarcinales archaeon Met12]